MTGNDWLKLFDVDASFSIRFHHDSAPPKPYWFIGSLRVANHTSIAGFLPAFEAPWHSPAPRPHNINIHTTIHNHPQNAPWWGRCSPGWLCDRWSPAYEDVGELPTRPLSNSQPWSLTDCCSWPRQNLKTFSPLPRQNNNPCYGDTSPDEWMIWHAPFPTENS